MNKIITKIALAACPHPLTPAFGLDATRQALEGRGRISVLFAALFLASCAETPAPPEPVSWLQQTEQQAIADGVSPTTVHEALDNFVPNPRVIILDQKQPETTITFAAYRRNVVTEARINKGAGLMRQYAHELSAIETRTGVPPEIVVALWGIESSFGRNMGDYETVNSLASLAYQGRRAEFFRGELFAALHILDQEHMPSAQLRGSWAGAMGQCQFMPSTYLKYAVDGDGDGRRDIWGDPVDVMASIANYLAAVGWQSGMGWGHEIGSTEADTAVPGTLMQPDGANGASFFTTDNIHAIMRWNHSIYFALSVGLLADGMASN